MTKQLVYCLTCGRVYHGSSGRCPACTGPLSLVDILGSSPEQSEGATDVKAMGNMVGLFFRAAEGKLTDEERELYLSQEKEEQETCNKLDNSTYDEDEAPEAQQSDPADNTSSWIALTKGNVDITSKVMEELHSLNLRQQAQAERLYELEDLVDDDVEQQVADITSSREHLQRHDRSIDSIQGTTQRHLHRLSQHEDHTLRQGEDITQLMTRVEDLEAKLAYYHRRESGISTSNSKSNPPDDSQEPGSQLPINEEDTEKRFAGLVSVVKTTINRLIAVEDVTDGHKDLIAFQENVVSNLASCVATLEEGLTEADKESTDDGREPFSAIQYIKSIQVDMTTLQNKLTWLGTKVASRGQ